MSLHTSLSASPGRALIASIIGVILLGTALLMLPMAQAEPLALLDLLFIATSATCVTGLSTVSMGSFTLFGQAVILTLVQIGGLGLITMTVFLISIFFKVGMKTHLFAGQLLELDNWKNIRKIITFIIVLTITTEILGAFLLFWTLPTEQLAEQPWFTALFHSVAAFCSAGFSIFPEGLEPFEYSLPFLLISGIIIIIGELGFITWHELGGYMLSFFKKQRPRLSLHSKIILSFTIFLLSLSIVGFWLLEYNNILAEDSLFFSISNTIFNAISFRSCGFTTLPVSAMHYATLFLIMLITFIGSSPGSTGSGIKITTFAVLFATARSVMSGRTVVEMKGRTIPNDQVFKVMAVFTMALTWIALTTFLLLVTEKHQACPFITILFESFSAFSNLGVTLGVTPTLSTAGKCIIMTSMVVGRVGALTLILSMKKNKETVVFQYPEERIMLS